MSEQFLWKCPSLPHLKHFFSCLRGQSPKVVSLFTIRAARYSARVEEGRLVAAVLEKGRQSSFPRLKNDSLFPILNPRKVSDEQVVYRNNLSVRLQRALNCQLEPYLRLFTNYTLIFRSPSSVISQRH